MIFDTAIVGGGIAGLYTAYRILCAHPQTHLLLLEKNATLGGRIDTYTDSWMSVEAGAGRFARHHRRLIQLIHEMGLTSHIQPIEGHSVYVSSSGSPPPYTMPDVWRWIKQIHLRSQSESIHVLQNTVFLDYAQRILKDESKTAFLLDSFGYSTELVVMNAFDALPILRGMSPHTRFYTLRGGLSQLVERLVAKIRAFPHVRVVCKQELVSASLEPADPHATRLVCRSPRAGSGVLHTYRAHHTVFALTQPALAKLACFRPIRPLLDQVTCRSLCRIYSVFPPDPKTGRVWFHDKPKMTTDGDLRMIIPIDYDKGIVMTSYTDNAFADRWNRVRQVDAKLVKEIETLVGEPVPKPLHTRVFYWKCGVGYWAVGANSRETSRRMIHPFDDHPWYICGENFSEKNQQWVEGALETSESVVKQWSRATRTMHKN
jgi:hypothetical protein